MSQSSTQNSEGNVVSRAARLPLLSSVLQRVTSVYADVKGRYALVGLVGGVAEIGLRNVSQATARRAEPLLQSLEPQIRLANSYACMGLDQLEKNLPILHQSVEEVMGHLKDAFFLTLDDLQVRVNEELDRILERTERLVDGTQAAFGVPLGALRDSSVGAALALGFDNLLTRSEEAAQYYLPLPAELQRQLDQKVQSYEDEEEGDEPGTWTRVRSLMLCVSLYLYHQALLLRGSLQHAVITLGTLADLVGLTQVTEAVITLSQRLLAFLVSRGEQLESLRMLVVSQVSEVARMILGLRPVSLALALPAAVRDNLVVLVSDLQELSKILIQLLINTTPLYNMLQQPSEQQLEDYLSQEDLSESCASRRGSSNSLFLKAPDGRPRRRRSLYVRSRRGSTTANASASATVPSPVNGRRGSLKLDSQPASQPELDTLAVPVTAAVRRRSSATEVLLAPIMQLVSQGQRAFEYLSPTPHQEDTGIPVVHTTEH
ncbi:perilipin 6 [Megalops cyprinoides]|uniref:perilipin 6 n=1 Tax=Megalops cyprinoides TaxID=118141 RepID=UPI0018651B82|nr:perilipin 6 [Megalops cyprinoides]